MHLLGKDNQTDKSCVAISTVNKWTKIKTDIDTDRYSEVWTIILLPLEAYGELFFTSTVEHLMCFVLLIEAGSFLVCHINSRCRTAVKYPHCKLFVNACV